MVFRSNDDPKIDRLSTVQLFRHADRSALRHLASAVDEVSIDAGTTLISQGHHHNEAYIITEGSVSVAVDGEQVATLGKGQMFGELGLFSAEPATATVVSAEPSTVLVVPYNRFDQVLDENPSMAKQMAKQLAARLRQMDHLFHHDD